MTLDINKFLEEALTNGGATWPSVSQGYMVSRTHDFKVPFDIPAREILEKAKAWLNNNKRRVNDSPNFHLGAWVHNHTLYLEVSERFDTKDAALKAGYDRNQLAIYDVSAGESIYLHTHNGEAA